MSQGYQTPYSPVDKPPHQGYQQQGQPPLPHYGQPQQSYQQNPYQQPAYGQPQGHHQHPQQPQYGQPQHQQQQPQNYQQQPAHNNTNYTNDVVYGQVVDGKSLYGVSDGAAKKFVVTGYKDVWCAVFFLLVFIGSLVYGFYNLGTDPILKNSATEIADAPYSANKVFRQTLAAVAVGLVSGAVLSVFGLIFFMLLPTASIVIANLLMIAYFVGLGIWLISLESYYGGIVLFLIGGLRLFLFIVYRKYIPFSAVLLQKSASFAKEFPGTVVTNFGLVLAMAGFSIIWVCMWFSPVYKLVNDNSQDVGIAVLVMIIALFILFWTSQVSLNIGHVTSSGVVATWYFCGEGRTPAAASFYSLKRALTTSFGSICFGSLLVAILQTLKAIARSYSRGFIGCIMVCILNCLEGLLRLFNKFAFVYVAMYGYKYTDAGRATFDLASRSAFEALFNNLLVVTTLAMFGLVNGGVVGVVSYYATKSILVAVVAGIVAMLASAQIYRVVDSSVTTLFVCLAEEPHLLETTSPSLYQAIAEANAVIGGDAPNRA